MTKPNYQLLLGDCLVQLKSLPDNSVDSVVTDPPYGINFMGKKWDYDVPSTEVWKECLRVLKPGGHLLSFSSARTYHRMAVAVEDAGFEIRDQIMWVYGSGFPKSHNIGKAEAKLQGTSNWEGWGTALKPAHEPIVLARKPLAQTVARNVLEYGTGGINIDACRNGDRFPANFIHDGIEEDWGRYFYCPKASKKERDAGLTCEEKSFVQFQTGNGCSGKASSISEGRTTAYKNIHPTVKPIALMQYLCDLITPPGGVVLDPYMGSGSTGCAAMSHGYRFIGMEMDEEYLEIAHTRIEHHSHCL